MKKVQRLLITSLVCTLALLPVMENQVFIRQFTPIAKASETDIRNTTEMTKGKASLKAAPNVAEVTDYLTLEAAMKNSAITEIEIMNDINFSNYTTGSAAEQNLTIPTRSLTIDGNGHTVDFRSRGYLMTFGSTPVNVVVKDISMFGRNYWGPLRLSGTAKKGAQLTYENVTYTGAQLTCSYEADVNIVGDVINSSVNSYVSPFDGLTYITLGNQVNLEVTNINFLENSHYVGSTENATVIWLSYNGTADIAKNARVDLTRGGSAGEEGTTAFRIDGNLNIHDDAILNITTSQDSTSGGITLNNTGTQINVNENASLNVTTNGALTDGRNPIYVASGAAFRVDSGAKLVVNSRNTKTSYGSSIYTGDNCSFIIAKDGTFDVTSDGTGTKNLIRIGVNAIFQFADAKRVNLQLDNTSASSRLIYMYGAAGKLVVDVQSVKAWNAIGSSGDTGETYLWNPMYGMKISYSGTNVTTAVGNSINLATQTSFTQNFRTQNFKRVLFEGIPDVGVSIQPLSDNKTATNSHVITGVATPGAYVRLSGDPAIPAGTIASQDFNDTNLYHVIADGDGKYSYTLPENTFLKAGSEVTAYGYLNGKFQTDKTTVLDETAPDAPTLNSIQDTSTAITGTAEPLSTVTVYNVLDNAILASGTAGSNGQYSLTVNERPISPYLSYYATATDAAGNISPYSTAIIVSDTTAPTASPLTQYLTLGDIFTTDAKTLVTDAYDNAGTENITYTIKTKPDTNSVGYSSATVSLRDQAGNEKLITIPVFITDSNTTKTDQAMLQASNFKILTTDVPTGNAALDSIILSHAKVKAWDITTGADITNQVSLTDKGGLSSTPGQYIITLQVKNLEKQITVTVTQGSLEFTDVTETISFGAQKITSNNHKIAPETAVKLQISDTRSTNSNWKVFAQLESPLQTEDGNTLPDSLAIDHGGTLTSLSVQSTTEVFANNNPQSGVTEIDLSTGGDASIVLDMKPGMVYANKEYRTKIIWTLEDAP
ncbi:hypothetical protein HCB21_07340 [Listeria booriae]|uniref:pectate lyase-like adhesive domain-containing protein n=1 Tax=Listeria booriae TaxID=1552123 RepID=UPI0016236748|nr:pectate lyase-like adhesive domain-containing protein [Listeria booriae]MBC2159575.1 hypothetical protein [Listeria booriae]